MYYLAQTPASAATEPLIRHSFTLPSLSTFTSDVKQIFEKNLVHFFLVYFVSF
jgi:hypothetical protein